MMTLGMLAGTGVRISFVGFAEAAATTLTLPTHQAGDLLFMYATRKTTGTLAAAPAGWTSLFVDTTTVTSFQIRVATQVAAAPGTASGTWTGASDLACFVYRGATLGDSAFAYRTGTSVVYPSLTMQVTSGSSWIVGGVRCGALNNSPNPAGRTSRNDGGVGDFDLWDTNGGVTSYTPDTITNGVSAQGWYSSLELKE